MENKNKNSNDFDYIVVFEPSDDKKSIVTKIKKLETNIDKEATEEKRIQEFFKINQFTNWFKGKIQNYQDDEKVEFSNQDQEFKERTPEEYESVDFSSDRRAVKYVKSLRKNRIKFEKNEFKTKIKNETDSFKKKKIKEEYKNKIIEGNEENTNGNIIEVRNLNKYYFSSRRFEKALKDINLEIPKGKFILILGPSGSGKTTLLNTISGLDSFDSGDLIAAGKNLFYLDDNKRIDFRANHLSFIFQSYNLISTLTVEENIKIGENLRRKDSEEIPIPEILENLGLTEQANKYPFQLSGGQQQRVSIARALAKNPSILFADEPTGALDEERGKETIKLLIDINKKYGTTLIIVTHNPNFEQIADVIIKVKDGRINKYEVNENPIIDIDKIKWG